MHGRGLPEEGNGADWVPSPAEEGGRAGARQRYCRPRESVVGENAGKAEAGTATGDGDAVGIVMISFVGIAHDAKVRESCDHDLLAANCFVSDRDQERGTE